MRGSFPKEPAKDLATLTSRLHAAVRRVEFRANETPVMAVTITYYKP